tara:strand:+ start:227 stop:457 length:231 start_codon:yes stop_codon:yes gene_type:complete
MNITYEINGINYLLFECPFIMGRPNKIDDFYKSIRMYNGIIQSGIKQDGGFWGTDILNVKVLIPTVHAVKFSATME